ncbi:GNAT family protein [soil metagenome]
MSLIPESLVLENDRVQLRLLTMNDADNLLTFSLNEPELWNYSLLKAAGKDNLKNYLDLAMQDFGAGISFPFIVFDKKTMQYAGSTRYYDIQPQHKSLQIGYTWYGKAFQGTGLNKNCKYLLLEYSFEILDCERVEFRADATNKRSIAAMKSIGCTAEGILRSHVLKHDGARRDSIVLSILKNEWQTQIKDLLAAQIKYLL